MCRLLVLVWERYAEIGIRKDQIVVRDCHRGARVAHDQLGAALTAFIAITPFDSSAPDDIPERLRGIPEIEACHSVAGEANYLLKVRVGVPSQLEELIGRIRTAASVSTHTTIVLSTPWE